MSRGTIGFAVNDAGQARDSPGRMDGCRDFQGSAVVCESAVAILAGGSGPVWRFGVMDLHCNLMAKRGKCFAVQSGCKLLILRELNSLPFVRLVLACMQKFYLLCFQQVEFFLAGREFSCGKLASAPRASRVPEVTSNRPATLDAAFRHCRRGDRS